MATTKREISGKTNSAGKSEIIIRLSIARGAQYRLKTGIFINPVRFKGGGIVKPRTNQTEITELRRIESAVGDLERYLLDLCASNPRNALTKDFIIEQLDRRRYPEKYEDTTPQTFFGLFDIYLEAHPLSPAFVRNARVLYRAMKRYEIYTAATGSPFNFTLDELNSDDIKRFETFLRDEVRIYKEYPSIYVEIPADTRQRRKSPAPKPRGDNSIVTMFKRLRMFFRWCQSQGYTTNNPFVKYDGVRSEKYGTPYYITIEERDRIAGFDLSATPALEVQRDIFIFHCLIGCRVSDLMRLTPANIINGAVEYVANKTRQERPEVIRVPLHRRALEILRKYAFTTTDGRILPFISPQRYNDAIKRIFTCCNITRLVTVLNPTTGKEEQRPLNEIASSHLARRTFVGNLYKQVKDPNLVGKLSGHTEGSRAFARYRDIDEDMKRDLINLLGD